MPSTANIVAGPSGVGVGAVLYNGIDDYIELVCDKYAIQTFSWELEFLPDAQTTGGGVVRGPNGGWSLVWDPTNQRLVWTLSVGTLATPNGSVPAGTWSRVLLNRNGSTGLTEIFVNRTRVAFATFAGTITYGALAYVRLGTDGSGFSKGRIGYVRASQVVRATRYVNRAYWLMRRNPVELYRELLADELKVTIDDAGAACPGFDQAAIDCDAVEDGGLKCDGYITDEVEAREPLAQLSRFREFRMEYGIDGFGLSIAKALSTASASFGDDALGNIVAVTRYTRGSLEEAIKRLPIQYRVRRNPDGSFGDFAVTVYGDVLTVGKDGAPLAFPFVYDHVTADILRCWYAKTMVLRDKLLELTVAHEGRALKRAQAVVITLITLGLAQSEQEILALTHRLRQVDLSLSPYDPDRFVYVAGTIPDRDPIVNASSDLDPQRIAFIAYVGDPAAPSQIARFTFGSPFAPGLIVLAPTPSGSPWPAILLGLDVGSVPVGLTPAGDGDAPEAGFAAFGSPVGAATKWQAVQTDDGAVSYVPAPGDNQGHQVLFTLTAPSAPGAAAAGITVRLVLREHNVPGDSIRVLVKIGGRVRKFSWQNHALGAGGWIALTTTIAANPNTGLPWSAADLTALQVGVEVTPPTGASFDLGYVGVDYDARNPRPASLQYLKFWRLGPAAAQPANPTEDTVPLLVGDVLTGYPDLAIPGAGTYWYYCRPFDRYGRSPALLGPIFVQWGLGGTP